MSQYNYPPSSSPPKQQVGLISDVQYQQFQSQPTQPNYQPQGAYIQQQVLTQPQNPQQIQAFPQQYVQQNQQVYGFSQGVPSTIKIELPRNLDNFEGPTLFHCPFCNHQNLSTLTHSNGSGTYTCCCLLCCTTCSLCWLPFVVNKCRDRTQFCAVCGAQVGHKQYKPC